MRICPICRYNLNIENILESKCPKCGYSIYDIIYSPSNYQLEKIEKHRLGSETGSTSNWIFDIDEKDIIKQIASHGSTSPHWGVVTSFPYIIGHKQTDPEKTTKWAAIVLHDYPEHSHAIPVDPNEFEGDQWKCVNCGYIHIDECPILCKNCGNHMWLENYQ
jgi:rubrerythrin